MDNSVMIPYFAHEGEMSRMERTNKRLWILILVLVVALIGTNVAWILYESQFSEVVTETTVDQQVDTGSGTAVISGTGDAIYGTDNPEGYGADTVEGESR